MYCLSVYTLIDRITNHEIANLNDGWMTMTEVRKHNEKKREKEEGRWRTDDVGR